MRTRRFANGLTDVPAVRQRLAAAVFLAENAGSLRLSILRGAGLALLLSGCAIPRDTLSVASGSTGLVEPQVSRFGTVAFAEEFRPATISFQKAKGKKGSVKEAIWDSAELGLSGPGAGVIVAGEILSEGCWGDPIGETAIAGAVGGVTAIGAVLVGPAVGAEGLIRSLRKVSPAELAQRETALQEALSQMAQQQPFHDALLRTGAERIRGGFFSAESENSSGKAAADVILEARVEDLRLERAGSSEGSYFLHIKTHVRVVRGADDATCFEQHAEYRSGTALFLDWTLHGAIEGVAETGYQVLARYYVNQLLD